MRILLIEDDRTIADFVLRGLREEGFAVDHAANGEDGLHLALTEPYDAAVVDLMLPRRDGLSVIHRLREARLQTPVIILSAKGSVDDRVKGLHSGADDYLTKPFAIAELIARVQALIRRSGGIADPTVIQVADLRIDLLSREVRRGTDRIDLQPKEYALLEYLMRNAGRVVTKTMIIEHVWDYSFDPGTNVVEARVCRLRDKIDKPYAHKLIQTIRGAGYVLKEDPAAAA